MLLEFRKATTERGKEESKYILNSLKDLLPNVSSVHVKYIFNMNVKLYVN